MFLRHLRKFSTSSCLKHEHNTNAFNLKSYRSLINVKGPDASAFMQGLITNDIRRLDWPNNPIIYSMILNNRGRTLFDVLIYKLKSSPNLASKSLQNEQDYLIEFDFKYRENAMRFLSLFRIKKKVEIKYVDDQFRLFSLLPFENTIKSRSGGDDDDNKDHLETQEEINKQFIKPSMANHVSVLHYDPRWSKLGKRLVVKVDQNAKNINFNKASTFINSTVDREDLKEYKKFLFKYGVAENNDEFKYENSIPLEYNLVFMNGVQFDKGCYLGQELVAKTHHTGVIRKRVMPLVLLDENKSGKFEKDNEIINTKTGQSAGKLLGLVDQYGIGLIRLTNIDRENLILVDSNKTKHRIKVSIPSYWRTDSILTEEFKKSFS